MVISRVITPTWGPSTRQVRGNAVIIAGFIDICRMHLTVFPVDIRLPSTPSAYYTIFVKLCYIEKCVIGVTRPTFLRLPTVFLININLNL